MSDTEVGELLSPSLEALETVRSFLALAALAAALVLGGAKLERYLMKRQLEVLDGAAAGADVDLSEGTGGGRT